MESYLESQDDGLLMRESGPWVIEKLDYLKRYIDIFSTSMRGKPWRAINYIDLFSGPGKCHVPETRAVHLGSPLLALTTQHPFTGYFFVDLSNENINALQERCNASPIRDRIRCFIGDSNIVITDIVENVLNLDKKFIPGQWSSLNLAFLDPNGLELEWHTVATLAKLKKIDLIIYYPQMGLTRNMSKDFKSDEETRIDVFFGGTKWRDIYERYQRKKEPFIHRQLMDYYKANLQKLDYKEVLRDDEVGDEPLIRNAKKNAPLYRLLFASKHPLGHDFWKKVIRRDVYGQARLPL